MYRFRHRRQSHAGPVPPRNGPAGPPLFPLITGLLLFALAIGIVVHGWILKERRDYLEDLNNRLELTTELKAEQLIQWRKERLRDGLSIMANETVVEGLVDWLDDSIIPEVRWELQKWLQSLRYFYDYEDVLLVHESGSVLHSSSSIFRERLPSIPSGLTDGIEHVEVDLFSLPTGIDSPSTLLCLAIPLAPKDSPSETSPARGTLLLTINPINQLDPLLVESEHFEEFSRSWLVELTGDRLVYWGSDWTLFPSHPDLPIAPFREHVMNESGSFHIYGRNAVGLPVRGAAVSIPGAPWFVVTSVPLQIEIREQRREAMESVLIGVCFILIAGCGVIIYHRTFILDAYCRELEWQKDRTLMARKLFESRQRYKLAFDQAAVGIVQITPEGILTRFNQRFCHILGYSSVELLKKPIEDLTHPSDRLIDEELFRGLLDRKIPSYNVQKRYIHKAGHVVWVNLTVAFLFDPAGKPVHSVTIVEDISERKAMEEELEHQRSQLLTLFDGIEDNIYVADPNSYELLYINPLLQKVCGPDWRGRKCYKVLFGVDAPCSFCTTPRVFAGDMPRAISWEHENLETKKWFRCIDKPIRWTNGNWVKLHIASDITDLRWAIAAVRQSEAKYRLLVENIPQKIFVKDRDFRFISCNQNFLADIDVDIFNLPGKSDYDFFPRLLADRYRKDDQRVLETGETISTEEPYIANRHEYWVQTVKTPLKDDFGYITGILGIFWDISDRKKAEQERQRLLLELERKNREQAQITYIASHDLRSPLVNIQGFSHELMLSIEKIQSIMKTAQVVTDRLDELKIILAEELPEALHFIETSSGHIERLLAGILQYYRIGQIELKWTEVDLNAVLEDVQQILQFVIIENQTEITVERLPKCQGDYDQIVQLFLNLLGNAIKYRSRERPCQIRIAGWMDRGNCIYCVEDNGVGIPQSLQTEIFELFHRLAPEQVQGEGLGLPIVQTIVARHRGRMWVESQAGLGSKFFISLPKLQPVVRASGEKMALGPVGSGPEWESGEGIVDL